MLNNEKMSKSTGNFKTLRQVLPMCERASERESERARERERACECVRERGKFVPGCSVRVDGQLLQDPDPPPDERREREREGGRERGGG